MSVDTSIIRLTLAVKIIAYSAAFGLGLLLASMNDSSIPYDPIKSLDESTIDIEPQYYRGKLQNASFQGCRMSIEEFHRYHALKAELQARTEE